MGNKMLIFLSVVLWHRRMRLLELSGEMTFLHTANSFSCIILIIFSLALFPVRV